jgi:hypothetical protein
LFIHNKNAIVFVRLKAYIMQKKLIARTAKLLSESKKSRRHQGVAVAYEHIPKDIDERRHGAIYAVVNVKAPAALAEEVGEVIVDTFHGEYYQDLNRDPVASFEAVLTRVNEELAEITHQGNTAWLGNLHAVLAVIAGDTILLTRTGKAEAYLYRGGRAGHATEGIEGDNVNPLRTFAYTGSAELQEGDKMAIATPGVFYHVSKDELQRYVQEFQPKVAISHLADLLEDNTGEVHPNSILIIEAITPEAASEETVQELDDEVWITEPAKPVQTAIDAGTPFVKKAFLYLGMGISAISAFVTLTAWPKIKEWSLEVVDIAKNLTKKDSGVLVGTKEAIVSDGGKVNADDITINETTNELVEKVNPNALYIKETTSKPKFLNIDFTSVGGIAGRFQKLTKRFGKNRKNVLYAAIGLVLVLSIGIFSVWKIREGAENQKLAQASYTEATSKYDIAQTQLSAGNNAQAAETLNSALALTDSLQKNTQLKAQANDLAGKIHSSLDKATGVVRVEATQLADASQITGSDTWGPFLVGTNLYVISKKDASIASVASNGGEVSRVLDKPNLDGKVIAATSMAVRSVLVMMTDKGKTYEFDTKDVKLNQQTVAGEFEQATALASFSTNIYSLDGATGKIYKRLKNSSGYSARTEYIVDGTTARDAVSIAIDSNLYAMKNNGEITKYLGGKTQDFALTALPISVSKASQVFTNEDTTGLYELEGDSARVIHFDKKGAFQNQYVSDNFKGAAGVYVNDANKTLYVIANGKIYKSSI